MAKFQQNNRLTENKMGTRPIGRLLAGMAIPMMISMLVQAFYNVVDSIYVSQISENALTAVSLAFPLQNLMIAFGTGTGVGMNALLSRALGAKEPKRVSRIANTGVLLFALTSLFFALIGIFCARPFFLAQTDVAEIVDYGTAYASICLEFSFGLFSQFLFERILQSTGKTGLSMITQLLGAVINIVLDPILIFGKLGFAPMGVAGAAAATVIGQIISAVLGLLLCLFCNPEVKLSLKQFRWHSPIVKEIYSIGVPSIFMMAIASVMTFGLNKILIGFSTTATAVFGAYFKLQSFIFMPIFGLNNGMVPIISYNFGAKQPQRVHKTITLTILAAVALMGLGAVAFELIPETLLGFFNASETMLEIGVPALRIIASHFLLAGFSIISSSVFQAIGNPLHALINSVCRQLVVILPVAWLLSLTGRLELVWLAFPAAEVVSVILNGFFLRGTMKKADAKMAENTGTV